MDFESLRTSENKYKRYFYETIQECARRFELEEETKNEIYETFLKKCEKQHPKIDGFSGPFKGKYFPKNVITNAATKGSTTSNHACSARNPPSV